MRVLLVALFFGSGCDNSVYTSCSSDDLVIEIGTSTLGDDGVHKQGESCYTVSTLDGSIDYRDCCPSGWDYLALGSQGGILCQAGASVCPQIAEVAEYSDVDGVTTPLENCPIRGKDGSLDYNECCPGGFEPIALGPELDTIICARCTLQNRFCLALTRVPADSWWRWREQPP